MGSTAALLLLLAASTTTACAFPSTWQTPDEEWWTSPFLVFHTSVLVDNNLILNYGGLELSIADARFTGLNNQVYAYNVAAEAWDGQGLASRSGVGVYLHSAGVLQLSSSKTGMVVFGGVEVAGNLTLVPPYSNLRTVVGTTSVYYPDDDTWDVVAPGAGPAPAARAGHASTVIDNTMYVAGGCNDPTLQYVNFDVVNQLITGTSATPVCLSDPLSDLWALDADLKWRSIPMSAHSQKALALWLSASLEYNGFFVTVGGTGKVAAPTGLPPLYANNVQVNSVFALNVTTGQGTYLPSLPVNNSAPYSAVNVQGFIMVFGSSIDGYNSFSCFAYQAGNEKWTTLENGFSLLGPMFANVASAGQSPSTIGSVQGGFKTVAVGEQVIHTGVGYWLQRSSLLENLHVLWSSVVIGFPRQSTTNQQHIFYQRQDAKTSPQTALRYGASATLIDGDANEGYPIMFSFSGGIQSNWKGFVYNESKFTFMLEPFPPASPSAPPGALWNQYFVDVTPEPRVFGAAAQIPRQRALVYGGFSTKIFQQICQTDTWAFDTATQTWTDLKHTGPDAFGHTLSVVGDALYLFGGSTCEANWVETFVPLVPTNQLYVWAEPIGWSAVTTTGHSKPGPRVFHSAVAIGFTIYVYGGTNDPNADFWLGDLWALDTHEKMWTKIPAPGSVTQPPPLYGQCATPVGFHRFVMFGGNKAGSAYAGTWLFDTVAMVWTEFTVNASSALQGRVHASCFWDSQFFWVAGGVLNTRQAIAQVDSSVSESDLFIFPQQAATFPAACNPGTFGTFADAPCQPCPAGFYQTQLGATSCIPCPGESFSLPGATGQHNCSTCRADLCNHGSCTMDPVTFVAKCSCQDLYFEFDRCRVPWALVLVLICGSIGAAIIALLVVRYRRRVRAKDEYSELQERLLEQSQMELTELKNAFSIDQAEVKFVREIGSGAFGQVWEGIWNEKVVAVKTMHAALVELDEMAAEDFEREITILRTLRHRNLVFFYGAGTSQGRPFIVFEYCVNGSLRSALDTQAPYVQQWSNRVGFALDAAKGMAFLHGLSPPRVHRDLKCANLLLTSAWSVKVADFGTARLIQGHVQAAHTDWGSTNEPLTRAVGTLVWTAPEVLRGIDYDERCDLYSFGIVCYEILTMKLPFLDVANAWDVRALVLDGQRPELPPGLGEETGAFVTLMQECWSDNPVTRPTFDAIVARLEMSSA